jgi:hypothetical protein
MPMAGGKSVATADSGEDAIEFAAKCHTSFATYKGHLTRAVKVFNQQVALIVVAKPITAELEDAHADVKLHWKKVEAALNDLIDGSIAAGLTAEDDESFDNSWDKLFELVAGVKSNIWMHKIVSTGNGMCSGSCDFCSRCGRHHDSGSRRPASAQHPGGQGPQALGALLRQYAFALAVSLSWERR